MSPAVRSLIVGTREVGHMKKPDINGLGTRAT
jgi:hypothetical protein